MRFPMPFGRRSAALLAGTASRTRALVSERGINMVDLMMWLVVASLLLAVSLQGIGFYQRAAYLQDMKSDVTGAGSVAVAGAASGGGEITLATADDAVRNAKRSASVTLQAASADTSGQPYLRAASDGVTTVDTVYLFSPCGSLPAGMSVVPKSGETSCGIGPSPAGPLASSSSDISAEGTAVWRSVSISGNGRVVVAGNDKGTLRTSTDAGQTWTDHPTVSASVTWRPISSSRDGSVILAGTEGGPIFLSRDSGATWTAQTALGTGSWMASHVSGDGHALFASARGTHVVWYSTDSGATWSSRPSPAAAGYDVFALTSSANGSTVYAGAYMDKTYVSRDGGATWTVAIPASTNNAWEDMATSEDGQTVVGGADSAYPMTSKDGGVTWTQHTELPKGNWRSVSASADGTTMLAVLFNTNDTYVSRDSGATWTHESVPGAAVLDGAISGDAFAAVLGPNNGLLKVGTL